MNGRDRKKSRSFGNPGPRTSRNRQASIGKMTMRPRILIVCEGKKTEPNYFLGFRVTNDIYGTGLETIRVVEKAKEINDAEGPFDQIWCIFDRDSFPPADFDNAIKIVESLKHKGFRIAYSNEAFELWYVLHFEYLTAALPRDRYIEKMSEYLGQKYKKGNPKIYQFLQANGNEDQAIKNAERLLTIHPSDTPISQRCPLTTVHELVKVLRDVQKRTANQ
jgi:hypothetical protein